ncbi:MAG: glycosyltransferase family 9 protein [Ignavibacteria bacterium]
MEKAHFKKILVTRTDNIGDVVLTLPLITELRKIFPSSKIIFLIQPHIVDLVKGYPGIDEVASFANGFSFRQKLNLLKKINPDLSIVVYPTFELAFLLLMAKVRYRLGSGYRWYSLMFNKRVYFHRKYAIKHESEYNLELLKRIDKNFVPGEIKFFFQPDEMTKKSVREKLFKEGIPLEQRYIIVHPGSRGSAKDLPLRSYRVLIENIHTKFKSLCIYLTGVEDERKLIEEIIIKGERVYNLSGKFTLRELVVLISNCEVFISNSTGPIHIAGALNKKIIGLYPQSKPMNPERWKPLSKECIILTPLVDDDMNTIKPSDIFNAFQKLYSGTN